MALLTSDFIGASEQVSVSFEPKKIRTGESAVLRIALPPVSDSSAEAEEIRREIQVVDDLLLKGTNYRVLTRDYWLIDGRPTWEYRITAYNPGVITIPPIEFIWKASTYSTERMEIEILTTRDSTDNQLRTGFGPLELPFRFPWWIWKVALALLGTGVALYLIRRFFPRLRALVPAKKAPAIQTQIPREDPLEWLKRQLELIRRKLESGAADERIVDELTFVIKRYFAMKTGGPVEAWTTREFQRRLTYDRKAIQLLSVFRKCDEYKFIGVTRDPLAFVESHLEESEKILTR